MGASQNTIRRWGLGEVRFSAMSQAFLLVLRRLQRSGEDLWTWVR
jgi:hypothetical protein